MILYKSKVARLTWLKTLIILILIVSAIQAIILLHTSIRSAYYHVFQKEVDYKARYGDGSWVIITGGSSGQGRHFSINFAARGFNLLLIGSRRSLDVKKEITTIYKTVEVRVILKDFSDAFDHDFFEEIEKGLEDIPSGRISFLINNIGNRVGYKPHHKMPTSLIRSTIACGTITQAMMTRLCLPYLLNREHSNLYSGIISITAQVMHPNHTFGIAEQNDLYLPYLAPYEASNAFGFFHSNSIYHEYKNTEHKIDMLVVTPGAVITPNTESILNGTIGAIRDEEFVTNIMRLVGNVQGVWSGSWKQGLSLWLVGIVPPLKEYILHTTGERIAKGLMGSLQGAKRVI